MNLVSALQELLGSHSAAQFLDEHYLRIPFARSGGVPGLLGPDDPFRIVAELLASRNLDLIVGRGGALHDRPARLSLEDARALLADGQTIGVRHIQSHHRLFADAAARFDADFDGDVDIHLYWTPADQPGFGWHYDAEEVFILQWAGSKTWNLRKNTVNPWPLMETIPANQRYEREIMPVQQCRLATSDWLYIPAGYWHSTLAAEESLSLSVGIKAPSAIDLFDRLREHLLASIEWRERLPPRRRPGDGPDRDRQERLQEIANRLGDRLKEELVGECFLQSVLTDRWKREVR